jgi:hypothetical protein
MSAGIGCSRAPIEMVLIETHRYLLPPEIGVREQPMSITLFSN